MSDPSSNLRTALEGRYALGREIGSGGMATVFVAHDLRHEREVAIKVLDPDLAASLGADRFLAEIRTTARLRHPHILPLFDSGEAGGFLFYVMPFVEGETLRDRLAREGQLSVEDAVGIVREVADGLAYAHEAGVIHRDIKPANILLSGGHATLADFGIARGVERAGGERLTQTGMSIGTPTYMSPEQAAGDGVVDGRSDVYSLACVLYETLAGEPPHTGPTAAAVLAKKVSQPPPRLRVVRSGAPEWLETVLTRALATTPADRFATAADLLKALSPPATGTDGSLSAGGDVTGRSTWSRRGVGIAITVVGLGLAIGWNVLRRSGGPAQEGVGDADAIAVLPFTVRGGPDVGYLREGMVDLLSTKLDGVGSMRTADPQAVIASLAGRDTDALSDADIARITSTLGVGRVIRGTVLTAGSQVHIQASVLDASGASTDIASSAEGPADDLFGLVDHLVSSLVAAGVTGGSSGLADLGELTTRSNEALRLYLDGVQNFRQGRGMQETTELLRQAVALDSTFALAAYWAGYMASYDDLPSIEDFELATRHRERLSPRGQLRLASALAGAEGRYADAIGLGQRFVQRYPDDVAGWFQLGEQISHTGYFVGDSAAAARPVYEHAVALEPALAPAYFHLAVIGGLQADTAALDRWAMRLDSAHVDAIWPAILRMTRAGVSGDTTGMDRLVDTFLSEETLYPPATLAGSISELAASVMVSDPSAARWLMERYARGTLKDTARAVVARRRARLESALGSFERAEKFLRGIGGEYQALLPYDLAWIALHPAATSDARVEEALRLLDVRRPKPGSNESAVRHYLLARLSLKLGRTGPFRSELDSLRREVAARDAAGGGLGRDLTLELAALDAQREGDPGRGLDSLLASGYWERAESWPDGSDGYFQGALSDRWPQFLRAELLRQEGHAADAARWYRVSADGIWHRVVGLERLGEVAAEAGDSAAARSYDERVERAWSGGDADVQETVSRIRGRTGG